MHGESFDASYRQVSQVLYKAFELSGREHVIRKALDRLKTAPEKYVNPGEKSGYRVTPTGVRRIEELLSVDPSEKESQQDLAPSGANGATPP
jgi:hypothetical protein